MSEILINADALIEEEPRLLLIKDGIHTWDELGEVLNLDIQGRAPHNSLSKTRMMFAAKNPSAPSFSPKNHWIIVKREVFELFCTKNRKYSSLRRQIMSHGDSTKTLLTALAIWLATKLGVTITALTPLIAVALYAIAEMGKNVWCELVKSEMED